MSLWTSPEGTYLNSVSLSISMVFGILVAVLTTSSCFVSSLINSLIFLLLFFFQANTKGFNYYRSPFCRLKSKLLVSRKLCVSSVSCQHFVAWDIPCRKSKSSSRLIPMSVSILVRSANHPVVSRCPQISI